MNDAVRNLCLPLVMMTLAPVVPAVEPVDKELIPEARVVLDYLASLYGKKTLAGISGGKNEEGIAQVSGRHPAIKAIDLSGWNTPTWGTTYTPVVEKYVLEAKEWWAKGGIVTMQFHWKHPLKPDGTAWVGKHGNSPPSGPFDMGAALKDGTPENVAFFKDLRHHADYLQQLAEARVPVLWRPFHEIDGGWFWWSDMKDPENTAAMWRKMYEVLVRERKLHNLIWVYSAALHCGKNKDVEAIDWRRRFYPGDAYVDIAGIDIYPNTWFGWGKPQDDAYAKAYAIMQKVTPGRMLALCESEAIPDPDRMAKDGPAWLYCLPWWGPGTTNPEAWIRRTYTHDFVITMDELPPLKKP